MAFSTQPVLGTPVVAATFDEAMAEFEKWAIEGRRAFGVSYADAHVIARGRHEPDFGSCLRKLDAVMPDGRPVLWGVNRRLDRKHKLSERLSGPDMFRRFQEYSASRPHLRHFYLGGSEGLLAEMTRQAAERCPGLVISGAYSPPFGTWPADELDKMCRLISDSGANIIWVGLGCPKQERWIADNLAVLPPGVYMAVGAAFAFYTGKVKRAPRWMRRFGLEWLHRILSEPRRLWKRYFVYNSLFLYYTLREMLGGQPSPQLPNT